MIKIPMALAKKKLLLAFLIKKISIKKYTKAG